MSLLSVSGEHENSGGVVSRVGVPADILPGVACLCLACLFTTASNQS